MEFFLDFQNKIEFFGFCGDGNKKGRVVGPCLLSFLNASLFDEFGFNSAVLRPVLCRVVIDKRHA